MNINDVFTRKSKEKHNGCKQKIFIIYFFAKNDNLSQANFFDRIPSFIFYTYKIMCMLTCIISNQNILQNKKKEMKEKEQYQVNKTFYTYETLFTAFAYTLTLLL